MQHYWSNEAFFNQLDDLLRTYPEAARVHHYTLKKQLEAPRFSTLGDALEIYWSAIQELSHQFGLRPKQADRQWLGYYAVHQAVWSRSIGMKGYVGIGGGGRFPALEPLCVEWDPTLTLDDVLRLARDWWNQCAAEVEKFAAALQESVEQPEQGQLDQPFAYRDVPHSLHRHICWLYLHICSQPTWDRPLGWAEIAKRYTRKWQGELKRITPQAVRREVEKLAEVLGIELPVLKGGRPRQFT